MKKSNQVNKYWIEDNDFCNKSTTDAFVNCDMWVMGDSIQQ